MIPYSQKPRINHTGAFVWRRGFGEKAQKKQEKEGQQHKRIPQAVEPEYRYGDFCGHFLLCHHLCHHVLSDQPHRSV